MFIAPAQRFESGEVCAFFHSPIPTTDAHTDGVVAPQFVFPELVLSSTVLSGIVQTAQSCLYLVAVIYNSRTNIELL